MKKYLIGMGCGFIGAIINLLFLLMAPNIEISVYISTLITWIVIGLLISASEFKINSIAKGILISILVSLPSLVFTIVSTISGAVWTVINTIIAGGFIGYFIDKVLNTKKEK